MAVVSCPNAGKGVSCVQSIRSTHPYPFDFAERYGLCIPTGSHSRNRHSYSNPCGNGCYCTHDCHNCYFHTGRYANIYACAHDGNRADSYANGYSRANGYSHPDSYACWRKISETRLQSGTM